MNTRNCPRCQDTIDYLAKDCGSCGARIDTELEIEAFHKPAIDSARKMILCAGFYYPLIPLIFFVLLAELFSTSILASEVFLISMGIGLGLFGVHLGLWWWAKKSPLPAASVALALFVGFVVWSGDITEGWLFKAAILFVLGRAVYAGYRVTMLRRAARTDQALQPASSAMIG